jgi:hypothetical protein
VLAHAADYPCLERFKIELFFTLSMDFYRCATGDMEFNSKSKTKHKGTETRRKNLFKD